MTREELIKLVEQTLKEGMDSGRQLEAEKDKSNQFPIAIHAMVKWRAQEIVNELNLKDD